MTVWIPSFATVLLRFVLRALVLSSFLLSSSVLSAGLDDFVITIKSDNTGTSSDVQFTLPTTGTGYNYNIDCNNDGTDEATAQTADYTCGYTSLGGADTYTVRVEDNSGSGTGLPRVFFNNTGDKLKILSVDQWGTGSWSSMDSAFSGASNMTVPATDVPDLSSVTSLSLMFNAATLANPDTSGWNTATITSMYRMFNNATSANPDTSGWNTAAVTTMYWMFAGATSANPNTSGWDTSAVDNMSNMFASATSANPDTSSWDTSAVTSMAGMFFGAVAANPDTSSWNTSSVTIMASMFQNASSANPDTSSWNTSAVTNMAVMFFGATSANPNTSGWNTAAVTNMNNMFKGATSANPNTSGWNTAAVTDMNNMFKGATSANPDISSWNTGAVTTMQSMFEGATVATPNTGSWDVSVVTDLSKMFFGATSANPDVSGWNVSSVNNMFSLFNNASAANPDVSAWDTSSVTIMPQLFRNATSANPDLSSWDVSNVTNMTLMFDGVTLPTYNYDALLAAWDSQILVSGVSFGGGNSQYCFSESQRTNMVTSDSWTISDNGSYCPVEDYADNNGNPVPTLADYADAGVNGVTAGNLAEVNAAIDALAGTDVDTLTEIQAIVDVINAPILTYSGPGRFDISNAVYAGSGEEFSILSEATFSSELTFSTDGSKMFISGEITQDVFEYSLSTAFDVSTAIYAGDGEKLFVGGQDIYPLGFAFNNDGSKLIIVGNDNNTLYEYALSTEFDVSTAIYAGKSLNISAQANTPTAMAFNNDGSKMFVSDVDDDVIVEYALGTNFDISTATYSGVGEELFVGAQETVASGFSFNNDGSKLFVTGSGSSSIAQYDLSTSFDVSTALYSGAAKELSIIGEESGVRGVAFDNTGSKVFIVGVNSDAVVEYSMVPGDIVEASANDGSIDAASTLVISLSGDTFQDSDTDNILDVGSEVTINNIPAGLTSVMTLSNNDSIVTLTFTGTATNHLNADDIADITFTFADSAFTSATAALVIGATGPFSSGVGINFTDPALSYAGPGSYDVSTAVYAGAGEEFSVLSETSFPAELVFNNDGSKLFILGEVSQDIFEYNLSTAFDVSTAIYAGDVEKFSVTSEDTEPLGLAFNNDGTKLYIVGNANNTLYGYDLSTAFDVSTAVYGGESFNINAQANTPSAMAFNTDGSKMFVTDVDDDSVVEYTLASNFDIATASYAGLGEEFSITAQEGMPEGLAFNSDGSKLFIIGPSSSAIAQYDLSVFFDVSTAVYSGAGKELSIIAQEGAARGLAFDNSGGKLFIVGFNTDAVIEYSLAPGNYSEATANDGSIDNNKTLSITLAGDTFQDTDTDDILDVGSEVTINNIPAGLTPVMTLSASDTVVTLTFTGTATNHFNGNDIADITFVFDDSAFTAATAANVTNATGPFSSNVGIDFNNPILTYYGPGQYDVSKAIYSGVGEEFSVAAQELDATELIFNNDGSKMFIVGINDSAVVQYNLTSAYDVSTAVYAGIGEEFDVSGEESNPYGLAFNNDGSKMYISGDHAEVYEYSLGTAYDVSTAVYAVLFDVAAQDGFPDGIIFNDTGSKMFIIGFNDSAVVEYNLSTEFDVSTATYGGVELSVSSQDGSIESAAFNIDGSKLYVLGRDDDALVAYNLATGYDLSSATYAGANKELSIGAQETRGQALVFDNTGSKLFIVGTDDDSISEYTLSSGDYYEVPANGGSIDNGNSIIITLNGETFQDTDTDNILDVGSEVTINNVPVGLTPVMTLSAGDTVVTLTFTGNATNHLDVNDVADLTFVFDDTAFTTATAAIVSNATGPFSSGIGLNFIQTAMEDFAQTNGVSVTPVLADYTAAGATGVVAGNIAAVNAILGGTNINGGDVDSTAELQLVIDAVIQILDQTDGVAVPTPDENDYAAVGITGVTAGNLAAVNAAVAATVDNGTGVDTPAEIQALVDVAIAVSLNYNPSGSYLFTSITFNDTFSVNAQELTPEDMLFNNNGSKLYVLGSSGDDINEYDLSTAYDVSSGVFVDSFSIAAQDTNPRGMAFNNDGSKLYMVGLGSDSVYEYDLSPAYDVSTGVFVDALSVAAQETSPTDMSFNADGSKLYITGANGNDITEYDLSPAFDISTSIFVDTISIVMEDGEPQGMVFNQDGTRFYMIGLSGDNINEYTLTTAYDVSTATFTASLSITAQEDGPRGLAFNNDHSKLYVVGNSGDDISEYDIDPTQFLSLVSHTDSFSVAAQEIAPEDMVFNNDGSNVYVVGNNGDDVTEFSLSSAFDVSTGVFVDTFSVAAQDTDPRGMAFNNDGSKLFVIGTSNDNIYEYDLSTPFDVSSGIFVDNFSVSAQETAPEGMAFNNDGSKLYVIGRNSDNVNEYDLSIPFDVSSGVFVDSLSVVGQQSFPRGMTFNNDGSKLYVTGTSFDDIDEYYLSTPFDVSTGIVVSRFTVTNQEGFPTGVAFNNDGSKVYIIGADDDEINEYSFDAFNYVESSVNDGSVINNHPLIITLSNDTFQDTDTDNLLDVGSEVTINNMPAGLTPVMTLSGGDTVVTLTFSGNATNHLSADSIADLTFVFDDSAFTTATAANVSNATGPFSSSVGINFTNNPQLTYVGPGSYDVSTAVYAGAGEEFSVVNEELTPSGFAFNNDGTKMFITGQFDKAIVEYSLSTAFDVSTAIYSGAGEEFLVSAQDTDPTGIALNNDGSKMFVIGNSTDKVYEYDLVTNFDVSSAIYGGVNLSVAAEEGSPTDIAFNADGSRIMVLGFNDDFVVEYNLGTNFDITTAVYAGAGEEFYVGNEAMLPRGFAFNDLGNLMFVVDDNTDTIFKYTLSTPFDVSTATYAGADEDLDITAKETNPSGIRFNADGSKFFIIGFDDDAVIEYNLPPDYVETAANNGSMDNSFGLTITLSGDTFQDTDADNVLDVGSEVTINNIPAGLTAVMTLSNNDTLVTLTLTGTATNHLNVDDINDITFTFADSAFTSSAAAIVIGATGPASSGISINFSDPAKLIYSGPASYNVAIAAYAGTSEEFSIAAEEGAPQDIQFNNDGSKMFIIGTGDDAIVEYNLSTTFDVSSAVYAGAGEEFSVFAQDASAWGFTFNNDGSKLFVVGVQSKVFEYALSSNFDISSAVYSGEAEAFDVSAQDTEPVGIAFNNSGNKMFIMGFSDDAVVEYKLSSEFDVSTASYAAVELSVNAEDSAPEGLIFNADGRQLFIAGDNGNAIVTYNLSTAFDLSTATYAGAGKELSVSAQETDMRGLAFNNSGNKLFIIGRSDDAIVEYDILSGSYLEASTNDGAINTNQRLVITLENDTFQDSDTDNLLDIGSEISINNVPAGLTPVMTLSNNDSRVTLTFTGTATNHAVVNDVADFSFVFDDTAFTAIAATNIINATGPFSSNVGINFINNETLVYAPPSSFDISSSVFVDGFSVAAQDNQAEGLSFSTDGTTMFIVGVVSGKIYQYNLATAFDTSSATFVASFSISAQDTSPYDVEFSADGYHMYMVGSQNDKIYEYSLSIPYTVATASFVDDFSVAGEDTSPRDVSFNNDGSKMYMVGFVSEVIYQYDLGTNFDISTALLTTNFYIGAENNSPHGVAFSNDGNKMFVLGTNTDEVNEYSLATPFAVNTATFVDNFSVRSEDGSMRGFAFSSSGNKLFIVGYDSDKVYEYTVGAGNTFNEAVNNGALDASDSLTITLNGDTFQDTDADNLLDVGSQVTINNIPAGLTAVMTLGNNDTHVKLTLTGVATAHQNVNDVADLTFTFDDSAFSTATASQVGNASGPNSSGVGINFNDNNPELIYSPADAFDISGAVFVDAFSVASEDSSPQGIAFSRDGTKMFVAGYSSEKIYQYDLTTAFDVSTASSVGNFSISAQDNSPRDVNFSNQGDKMFVIGSQNEKIYEYSLSTPYTVTSAAYIGEFSVASEDTSPYDVSFNSDGSKMYVVGFVSEVIYQYALSTAFDISSAVLESNFSIGAQNNSPHGVAFSHDGRKMFMLGTNTDEVNEYTLATPFAVNTAVFVDNFSVLAQDGGMRGLAFSASGNKLFISGIDSDQVYEYTLGSPNDFDEVSANDGSINSTDVLKITLTDDIFQDIDGDNILDVGSEVTINNIPAGLTAVVTLSSNDSTANLSFSGNASAHLNANDVADLTFTFANSAFTNSAATSVTNATGPFSSGVGINFIQNAMEDFAQTNGGSATPIVADYSAAGVIGVIAGNIATVNAMLAGSNISGIDIDTTVELQLLVDGVIQILDQADGVAAPVPDENDYAAVGITGVTASNLDDINAGVAATLDDGTQVDTPAELQALVDVFTVVFITTWKTENPGTSTDTQITIPTTGGGYNYNVDWGDGNSDAAVSGDITHTYAGAGTYSVKITGTFPRLYFNNGGDKLKILTLEQWGTGSWTSMDSAFYGASNLVIPATDIPDLSSVTSMNSMFRGAVVANPDTSSWNTAAVIDMNYMFLDAINANPDVSDWDTSSVTTMQGMFRGASNANPNTTSWNTAAVTDMSYMFLYAINANPDVSYWDTSSITTMQGMFWGASNANPDVSSWDVSNVLNMSSMFNGAIATTPNTSSWNTATVTDMSYMFVGATSANPDVSSWDTNNVIDMEGMFREANNATPNTTSWNTAAVTDMSYMFFGAINANPDVSSWDTSSVTSMEGMFWGASNANPNTTNWNTTATTDMRHMFIDATSANPDVSSWDVSNVTNMSSMFSGVTLTTTNYDSLLTGWNVQSLQNGINFDGGNSRYCNGESDRDNMIASDSWTITDGGKSCPDMHFVTTWKTDNSGSSSSTSVTIPTTGAGYLYDVDWDNDGTFDELGLTGSVTHDFGTTGTYSLRIRGSFPRIYFNNLGDKDKILSVDQWGNGGWTSMQDAFYGAANLTVLATDAPVLTSVTSLRAMFRGATTMNQSIGHWNISNVTNMIDMFSGASAFNQDISTWDTSKVFTMQTMFNNASAFNQNISTWDTGALITMLSMFQGATSFNQPIGSWDTADVTNMSFAFEGATSFNRDISGWDTSKVNVMVAMLQNATDFDQNLASWDISSITNMNLIFSNVTLSTANYDATLIGFDAQVLNSGVLFSGGNSQYCAGGAARANMIASDSWVITDGGQNCTPVMPSTAADLRLTSDSGDVSTDNVTLDNTPSFDIICTNIGNTITLYSDNPTSGTSVASQVCSTAGTEVLTASILADGIHNISYSDTNLGDESAYSPSLLVKVDTTNPAIPSCSSTPTPANNATSISTTCNGVETDARVTIAKMICSPIYATVSNTVSCSGTTGIGGGDISLSNDTVSVTDLAGNSETGATTGLLIDNSAPVIIQSNAITTPTADSTPNYSFSSNEAGSISYSGSCSSATSVAVSGTNTITFNALSDGSYSDCAITVTDMAGNMSNLLLVSSFEVDSLLLSLETQLPNTVLQDEHLLVTQSVIGGKAPFEFRVDNLPEWLVLDVGTGQIIGTPDSTDIETYSDIVLHVTDSEQRTAKSISFELRVIDINDAPIAENDTFTLVEGGKGVMNVLANDSDPDEGDLISIESVSSVLGGVTIVGDMLEYQTPIDFVGNDIISYTIVDSGGLTATANVVVSITYDPELGLPPTIVLPDDVVVNATGILTKVALGFATATDSLNNTISVSKSSDSYFQPGAHQVIWTAEDSRGRTTSASQSVWVHPLISIGSDTQVEEGGAVSVGVYLNGDSPIYPVVIDYAVSGSADENDHDLTSDSITVANGRLGRINFSTFSDDVIEGDESLDIQLSDTLNIAGKSVHSLTITESPLAPDIRLKPFQAGIERYSVLNTEGLVSIYMYLDTGSEDDFTYIWDASKEVVNLSNEASQFIFDPELVSTGNLVVNLDLHTVAGPTTTARVNLLITSDALQPSHTSGCSVINEQQSDGFSFIVEAEPQTCIMRGELALQSRSGGIQILEDELKTLTQTSQTIAGGVFDFVVFGKPKASTYQIVFPQRKPIPEEAVHLKFSVQLHDWFDFVVTVEDQIFSTHSTHGRCPEPNDARWVEGLTASDWCVKLIIKDGGPNDVDGIANGMVVDPGGVARLFAPIVSDNHDPVAKDDFYQHMNAEQIVLDVLDNDSDSDGDQLVLIEASADLGFADIVDGVIWYRPASFEFFGTDVIHYVISDDMGGVDNARVSLEVITGNSLPVAVNDTLTMLANSQSSIDVLSNDSDPDGDPLTLHKANTDLGQVEVSGGRLIVTPDKAFVGEIHITYFIIDPSGAMAMAKVTVTVEEGQMVIVKNSSGGAMSLYLFLLLLIFIQRYIFTLSVNKRSHIR